MATLSLSSHHHHLINVFFQAKKGLAQELLKFLDVKTIQEFLVTSRIICTFLADYYQHNEIHDVTTVITNTVNYFRFFPKATALNMSGDMRMHYGYSNRIVRDELFVGMGKIRMMDLSGYEFKEEFNP